MVLTENEKATNYETMLHIMQVQRLLLDCASILQDRCFTHDQSKLAPPEVDTFLLYTPKLRGSTYGSDEYKQFLLEMKPALDNHYANNRHHPEHFSNGIDGMHLLDVLEMFVDWIAASRRHADGDIYESIRLNTERFSMSPQLAQILRNTADILCPTANASDSKA